MTEAEAGGRARRTRALLLAATASVFIPAAAFAQSAPPADSTPAAATGATSTDAAADDIIVTAFKREQALSTVPQGISVVTGAQLDERGAKSLSDYIALTPGVSLQSTGVAGYGKIEIRGIAPLVVASTVATYVDDVPISSSSQTARGGNFQPDLDPSDIERVEVLKGPQGTLYGASSLGGVIKYVLRKPSLTKTEINTSEEVNAVDGGQVGTRLRGSVSTPVSDNLAIRVSGYYRHDPGYIDNVGALAARNVNDGDSWGVRGALYWKPTSTLSVNLTASIQDSKTNGYSTVDLDWQSFKPLYGRDTQLRATPETFHVRSEIFAATLAWDTGLGTLLSSSGYSYTAPRDTGDITYNFAGGGVIEYATPAAAVGRHINKQFSQEVRFTSKRFGPLEFTLGGFYQHSNLDDAEDFTPYKTTGVPDPSRATLGQSYGSGTLDEYAGFANATVYLNDQIDFTAGYRHSRIDQTRHTVQGGWLYGIPDFSRVTNQSTTEDADTYLFGARWRPTKDVMFYLRAASGYRPGGARSVPPAAPAGTVPFYKSDSIWSYEAGVKIHTLGGRLTLDADAFRIDWTNIQTLIYYGFFSTVGNGGKARSQGGEFQASFEPTKGLFFTGNAAYTDARYTENAPQVLKVKGQLVDQVPKWTATAGITYNWSLGDRTKASIGGDWAYKSSMNDFSAEQYTVPSYSTFNLRGGVEFKGFGVNFYVNNLTNKRAIVATTQGYYTFFNPFIVSVNQPRTYGINFTQNF